jgi:hypothetical protein
MTNENMLVTLDDAALDQVNGGASLSLGIGDTNLVDASLSFKNGLSASLKLFGKNILNIAFNLFG